MSFYDYSIAKKLWCDDTPFHALIMAAILQADPYQASLLGCVFPQVRTELQARYNRSGGKLPGDELDVVLYLPKAIEGDVGL